MRQPCLRTTSNPSGILQTWQAKSQFDMRGDILRSSILWRIWCFKNGYIFYHDRRDITSICQRAWRDTILAGIAHRNHSLAFFASCRRIERTSFVKSLLKPRAKMMFLAPEISILQSGLLSDYPSAGTESNVLFSS